MRFPRAVKIRVARKLVLCESAKMDVIGVTRVTWSFRWKISRIRQVRLGAGFHLRAICRGPCHQSKSPGSTQNIGPLIADHQGLKVHSKLRQGHRKLWRLLTERSHTDDTLVFQ